MCNEIHIDPHVNSPFISDIIANASPNPNPHMDQLDEIAYSFLDHLLTIKASCDDKGKCLSSLKGHHMLYRRNDDFPHHHPLKASVTVLSRHWILRYRKVTQQQLIVQATRTDFLQDSTTERSFDSCV
jgi:hypothetical protein